MFPFEELVKGNTDISACLKPNLMKLFQTSNLKYKATKHFVKTATSMGVE